MPGKLVSKQQQYWRNEEAARRSLGVVIRSDRKDIVQALCSDKTADQILYFFCHAASKGLGDPGGPTAAALGLTGANVTLDDLYRNDPATAQFGGSPLVFINACESADLSATFYDGFVPYFMAKGARGVVGTECVIPALFACTWSERFFKRFLDGQPLGDAFRDLRVEFVEASGNPLGLLYAVYCDGDTQIDPALVSQATAEVTA
jgi:hypothetical protein